ncbi:hypothetical protein FXO38_17455 [Capsicum annuum]|nr:hypothetical protein FXO38_17455 [Capsicum annuum]
MEVPVTWFIWYTRENSWRVELSYKSSSLGGGHGRGGDNMKCYECGELAWSFCLRVPLVHWSTRTWKWQYRSPGPRFPRSSTYGRRFCCKPVWTDFQSQFIKEEQLHASVEMNKNN